MSNSTSLPDQAELPQSVSAASSMPFDRMQADIKALHQQALATQASIKQLQARPSVDPLTATLSDVPAMPAMPAMPAVDTTVVSVVVALGAALALASWYSRQRPQAKPVYEDPDFLEIHEPPSDFKPRQMSAPTPQPQPAPVHVPVQKMQREFQDSARPQIEKVEARSSAQTPLSNSVFARSEAPMGFDSEAAANEVIRVRRSLAEKREARAMQRERDDALPNVEPSAFDEAPSIGAPPDSESQSTAISDPDIFLSMAMFSQPVPLFAPEPELEPEFEPALEPELERETESDMNAQVGPDYSITLALAQESESLELWSEARELANEVLGSADQALHKEATELLLRIAKREQEIAMDSPTSDIEP